MKIRHQTLGRRLRSDSIKHRMVIDGEASWMSREQWKAVIDKFIEIYKSRFLSRPGIMVMDRLHSHFDNETVDKLLESRIELAYLPPHSSHIIQPLDREPFGNAKRVFRRNCKLAKSVLFGKKLSSLENDLQSIVAKSEDEAFTKKVVKEGFKSSGLEPPNWELIENRINGFVQEIFFEKVPPPIKKRTEVKSLTPLVDRYLTMWKASNTKKKEREDTTT